jgi:hypothetical protein
MGVTSSVSQYIAECQRVIEKSGLSYTMHSYGTVGVSKLELEKKHIRQKKTDPVRFEGTSKIWPINSSFINVRMSKANGTMFAVS